MEMYAILSRRGQVINLQVNEDEMADHSACQDHSSTNGSTTHTRRPSISQPITPPRSIRLRDRVRLSNRSSSAPHSPSPRVLTPPTLAEGRERRRRARDSSAAGVQDGCGHERRRDRKEKGEMAELAVAGAMVAVFELDRLSRMARGEGGKGE